MGTSRRRWGARCEGQEQWVERWVGGWVGVCGKLPGRPIEGPLNPPARTVSLRDSLCAPARHCAGASRHRRHGAPHSVWFPDFARWVYPKGAAAPAHQLLGPSRTHTTQNAPTPWPSKQRHPDALHAGEKE